VWDGTALWLYSVVTSQRWIDISRDRRVAILVDAGDDTGHHAWLRLVPDKITSWDFRKKISFEDYDFG
jgi:hypothetical protein